MGLTFTRAGTGHSGGTAVAITLTIPANAAVGLSASLYGPTASGGVYDAGTVTDTGSNVYISASGVVYTTNGGISYSYSDAFYCLNTGASATSITYTPNAAYTGNLYTLDVAAWVWGVSGGSATFGSESSNGQSAPGTGTNAITTGSVTCAAGSVIMGLSNDSNGSGALTVGTGFTQNSTAFGVFSEYGAFSASQSATWTNSVGTDTPILSQAISFGFSAAGGGAAIAWVT